MINLQTAQQLDDLFGDQAGQICLGYIDGDPQIEKLDGKHQEWCDWPRQRNDAIAWLESHAAQGHNTYVRMCLFAKRSGAKKHALPSPWIWRDDVKDPRTAFSTLLETSEGNYQALIRLDRPATTEERSRLMTAWRNANVDSDDCSADPVHFIRVVGGHNRKRHGDWLVRYAGRTERVYSADKLLSRCQPPGEGKRTPPGASPSALDQKALDHWQAHIEQLLNTDGTLPRAFVRDTPSRRILELRAAGKGMFFHTSGTWDASRERLWLANGLVIARYTDEQIAALIWHFEVADTIEIKGKDAVWADIHRVIGRARAAHPNITPRLYGVKKPPKVPRGRAGDHAALVEQVYQLLQDARAGVQAIIQIADIASQIGAHRRTVSTILGELRDAGRISTRRLGQHGGLVVAFNPDVIYSPVPEVEQTFVMPQIAPIDVVHGETGSLEICVSPESREGDHISELPTLRALAAHYLDLPADVIGERYVQKKAPQDLLDTATGEVLVTYPREVRYRRTAKHFAALVSADYGKVYTFDEAVAAYYVEREYRKLLDAEEWRRFFVRLKAMPDDELIAYIAGGCRRDVAELARDGAVFDKHLYQTRLKCAKQHLDWRGLKMPSRKARIRSTQPGDAWLPEEVPAVKFRMVEEDLPNLPGSVPEGGLITNLFKLRDQRQAVQP